MDTHTPLTPDLDGFRAKVLTVKPRTYVCCICHSRPCEPSGVRAGICENPGCLVEAARREWL